MWKLLVAGMFIFLMSVGMVHAEMKERENMRDLSAEALSPGTSTKDPTLADPNQVPVGSRTVTGTVTNIKTDKRIIEIENNKGKIQQFKIDQNVRRDTLENIHNGDNVKLEVGDRQGTRVATSVEKQS